MRRIFKSFMLIAAAAMAFTSCQKEETAAPETVSATLTMHAGVEQTKTYLSGDNTVLWGKGESVSLYVGAGETAKFFDSASTDAYDGEASASFAFDIKDVAEADSYTLGGIYPASAAIDDNDDPKKCKTILPQIQNAELGKYDPAAYIMVLKPETVETLPEEYVASFRRATALNKITLTNVKEDITTVEITVPEGKALAGRRYFNLTDGESGEIYYGQSNAITVNSQYSGSTIDVWFCSWGVELAAGEELTVRMKNANKSFTRTIQAKEAGIKFVEGDLNTLKINMETAEEESFDSFAGEWLITGTTAGVTYAAGSYVSGNNIKASVSITISNDVIEPVDGLENCKMLFTEITEGDYKGMYTIQDANGKYLYAASSSANQLKAGDSTNSANYYWTVECNDGKYSIVASKSSNRNVMQFNPNNGSPIFACYASASQTAVVLYPYSMVKVDTTPKIAVTGETTKNVVFGGETVKFNYQLKYLDGEELSWEVSDSDMISSISAEDGVLNVTVAENDGVARTATITLSCGDAEEVVLTINQAEYVDTSVIEEISVKDFLEKSVDANVWYKLTGRIKEIKNTSYGNFYLEDETGYVYVYGLTAEKVAKNDQSFGDLDLKLGDIVTLIGTRAQYATASVADQKEQVGGPAYYVSHISAPTIDIPETTFNVEADDTSVEFKVSCDAGYDIVYPDGVKELSMVKNNDSVYATYTVEFDPNTTDQTKTYVITVKVAEDDYDWNIEETITINQAAVSQGDEDEPAVVSTYQHVLKSKPATGSITLSNVKWTLSATNLNNYNSANYAGVQFGTSSKTGKITLTSQNPFTYDGKSTVKEIRLWLNNGSGTITPTVTINGVKCTMTGTITKNSSAGSDYTKASLVTFTPAQPTSGVVVIDLSCNKAGYFCAMEIDVQ